MPIKLAKTSASSVRGSVLIEWATMIPVMIAAARESKAMTGNGRLLLAVFVFVCHSVPGFS